MGLPLAVSFEDRLVRDRMVFMLKLEILLIFFTALIIVSVTGQNIYLKMFFATLTGFSFALVIKDRLEKAGRKLRRAVVKSVKHRGNDLFFPLPMTPFFSFTANGFEVEAVSEDMVLVRFFDWKPWKIGQKLLILYDVRGKVLAVRDLRLPVKLEVLKKLV